MNRLVSSILVSVLALGAAELRSQVVLRSGQGLPGGTDPNVTFLQGPATGPFGAPFTTNDFQLARTGPNALVSPSVAGGWPYPMPGDPMARWIDSSPPGSTALYAIPFSINQPFASVRLRIQFAVDDYMGTPTEHGIYVNDLPIPYTLQFGNYYSVRVFETLDIGSLVQQGQNWLYLYQVNTGGAGGLIFSAEIDLNVNAAAQFGSGCSGSSGTPLYALNTGRPRPGDTMVLTLHNLPTGMGLFFSLFGFDNQSWNGQPLPVSLGVFGLTSCDAWIAPTTVNAGANLGGGALINVAVPNAGSLIGTEFYSQCLIPDAGAGNPAGLTVSNALGFLVGI